MSLLNKNIKRELAAAKREFCRSLLHTKWKDANTIFIEYEHLTKRQQQLFSKLRKHGACSTVNRFLQVRDNDIHVNVRYDLATNR